MVDIQLLKQQLLTNPYKNATSYHVYQNKISANTLDALDKQNVYEKFRDNRTEIFELARESVDNGLTGSDLVSAIKSSDVYEDLALTLPEEAFFFENLANVYDEGYISEVYNEGPDVPTPLDLMALPSQSGNNLLSSHQEGAPIEVISPQDELEQRMMSAAEGSPFSSQEPQEIEARENLFLHTFVPTNWMVSSVGGQELGHNGDDTVSMLDRGGGIAETVQDLTDNDLLPLLGALKEIDLNVDITSENIRDFLRLVQKRDLATELAMTDDEYAPEMARFGLVDPEKLSDMTSDYSETVFPAKIENYQKMIIEAKAFMETAGITD